MPKVTIDGIEVTVEPGTNLIEAAHKAGKTIPHFCYHPKLSIAGNCRMCMVEIEGGRRPEVACNTMVRDGMVVHTDTERVRKLRKAVLEFLFLNHPLDCPICDKAGECKLQDYYLEHGRYVSRLEEGKVRKPKRLDIGKHILLDTERCVLCTRCVRFCDEITGTGELRIFERGAHCNVGIHPDARLDNRYSICTTDLCPVGALTCKEFRFQTRAWYLEETPTICGECANGCNIVAHHYRGQVRRFMPRRNDAVNDTWMCDDGRLSFTATQEKGRLAALRGAGNVETQDITAAVEQVAARVTALRTSHGEGAVGFVLSPRASLEENHLIARIASALNCPLYLVGGNPVGAPEGDDDGFLIRADKNPNTAGADLVARRAKAAAPSDLLTAMESGTLHGLVCFNNDVVGKVEGAGRAGDPFGKLDLLVTFATHQDATVARAHVAIPIATYLETDGTWINHAARVQRFRRVVDPPAGVRAGWEVLPALGRALGVEVETVGPAVVFQALAGDVPELAGLTYDLLGHSGRPLGGEAPGDESGA